ncbi:hypothetical protein [Halorubrum halodurans]|uniref:Uncharacterized protein n=1 Tax=Halorubrum halodurans TaxID=1383851 RepID=A0A256IL94_9EURY|nr:hypothetical protein [Halorubrum halodurans]OYR57328.1 hypothetical protein DJ70_06300 [Halorubrum halodurans]
MNRALLPPAVAAVVAAAIGVTRRLPPILIELSLEIPSPSALSVYIAGSRFVSFVLVYGLLLGVAYRVGRGREGDRGDGTLVLATGGVAAVAYLVVTAGILLWLGPEQRAIAAVRLVGSTVSVGVQLAVVAFAGLALGRSRRPATAADA